MLCNYINYANVNKLCNKSLFNDNKLQKQLKIDKFKIKKIIIFNNLLVIIIIYSNLASNFI